MAESLYSEGDSTNKWSQLTIEEAKTVKVINLLSKEIKKNLKILDIGCNGGQLLDLAKMLGAITAGVDLSDRCIAIIKQKGHQHFSSIMEIDDNERFDIITAFDLVEHLYNVPAFFDFCKTKLVDNGKLIILTGNVFSLNAQITQEKWWYLGAPEHIVFPSRLYFKYHTPFQFKEIIYTYASIAYKEPVIKVLKSFFYQIFKDKYTGIPPICPDHVLIVLQKTNTK
ncbi:class I SAM-dependent methyltransferase [Candidatus Desantisbacteria bacterium]|nr:class I SAM-dependent methyltransferase [Candidatus Desantisbacteria bacterium]